MIDKILVPVDGSKIAEAALEYAVEIASPLNSRIFMISVYKEGQEEEKKQYRYLHDYYLQQISGRTKRKPLNIKSVIRTGEPVDEIVDYSNGNAVKLIIMGTRGRSVIARWILGSVADGIIAKSAIPVALISLDEAVSGKSKTDNIRKALIVCDGNESDERVVSYTAELAGKLGMEITLLQLVEHVLMYPDDGGGHGYIAISEKELKSRRAKARRYLNKLAEPLVDAKIPVNIRTTVKKEQAAAIVNMARRTGSGIIIMHTKGRSGIGRWFFGDVRDKVIDLANLLVLLVKTTD